MMSRIPAKTRGGAWLTLLRPPNLLTVPGDPLAGYMLARAAGDPGNARGGVLAVLATLGMYAAGLLANDAVDRDRDRKLHPRRPLPAGDVTLPAAFLAASLCAAGALFLAAAAGMMVLATAAALILCIACYTFSGKHVPWIGPLWMGACRLFSLWMGAAAAGAMPGAHPAGTAGLTLGLCIAAVTAVAHREAAAGSPCGTARLAVLPALILCVGTLRLFFLLDPGPAGWMAAGAAVLWYGFSALHFARRPETGAIGRLIGRFLRGLLLVQAAWLLLAPAPGPGMSLVLLAFWPLHVFLGRRFAPS